MGFLHECPSCHKVCEQNICTRTDDKGYETELLECSGCKHTWFATHGITEVNTDIVTCPKCGSHETGIDEGPWIYDDCMKFNQTCYNCGHLWTGIYKLPKRIGVEDESNFLEDWKEPDDEMSGMQQ